MSLENELLAIKERKSFNMLNKINPRLDLSPFQSTTEIIWLCMKRGLFLFDTGMGKNVVASSLISLLKTASPMSKVIFLVKANSLRQVINDIKNYGGDLKIAYCNASASKALHNLWGSNPDFYDILLLTHESLDVPEVYRYIHLHRRFFKTLIVDEAHNLCNFIKSNKAFMLTSISSEMEYVALLTATPVTTKAEQLAWHLYMMDPVKFSNTRELINDIRVRKRMDEIYPLYIHNYDRRTEGVENTYKVIPIVVPPHPHQLKINSGGTVLQQTRGEGSFNQINALIRTVKSETLAGARGVVYVYYKESAKFVHRMLSEENIKFGVMNGSTSDANDKKVEEDFSQGKIDVVVTSVAENKNLKGDYIFLYEYTALIKQIIGRVERGLDPRVIRIYHLFTDIPEEFDYFDRTVYARSHLVRALLGKDYGNLLPSKFDVCKGGFEIL